MVDKMELRNNFFSTSFPIPPPLGNDEEKFYFFIGGREMCVGGRGVCVCVGGVLETMILLFQFFRNAKTGTDFNNLTLTYKRNL